MSIRKLIFFTLLILLSSCQDNEPLAMFFEAYQEEDKNNFGMIARQSSIAFIKNSREGHHLFIRGDGGSFYGGEIRYVSIAALSVKEASLPEARNIVVYLSKGLISEWSQNEFLEEFAPEGGFSFNQIDLSIRFQDLEPNDKDKISVVFCNRNGISYYKNTSPDQEYIPILDETWEEAIARAEPMNEVSNPAPSFQRPQN